ncbi:replication initiation protein [Pseudonocardia sp. ICBG1293]|uniref:replication initiation protein n=1 Tax=Pseudonocardia sp. ICBG1293 TaxID=2844382 RepID=UPI001CC9853B|nr:replication initiation protein [Pseudonocardia sp. ICBG1293]
MPAPPLLAPPTAREQALRASLSAPIDDPGYPVGGLPFEAAREIWERLWTSRYPLAADAFDDGVWRQTREEAMTRMHVETHPKHVWGLIGQDVDHPDGALRALSSTGNHPMPNVIIENPVNGHAHLGWTLTVPVTTTNYGSRRSVRLGLAVEEALRVAVGGDPAYTGRLIKNPFHPRWLTHWIHRETRTLNQLVPTLAAAGHMPTRGWHARRRREPVGYSRNETLFHAVRHFAYREMRHHWGDPDSYRAAIAREVGIRNADFGIPLGANELGHLARSISDWTINYSRMWNDGPAAYDATFSAIQAARGRKGGRAGSGRNGGLTGNSRPGGLARGVIRADESWQLQDEIRKAGLV